MTDAPEKSKQELRAELAANEARLKALRPWYRKKRVIILGALVGLVVIAAVGSSSKDAEDTTVAVAAATGDVEGFVGASDAPKAGKADEADDVSATGPCELSEFGLAEMPITIVNNSSKTSTYYIEGVVERDGVKVGDMSAASANVAPGQTALDKLVAISVEGEGPVTCRIVDVNRMAS